jgi:hypothetical protein
VNEDELYAAYRRSDTQVPPDRRGELDVRNHSTKCAHGECPVMIADWTGRYLCRYHYRKAAEAATMRSDGISITPPHETADLPLIPVAGRPSYSSGAKA